MRIIHVTARADHGGGPKHVELLLKNLPDEFESHVACPGDFPYWERFNRLTAGRICNIPHRKFKVQSLLKLLSYVRRNRIDVIHAHGKGAGLYGRILAMLTGKPCLHTPHGVHVERYGRTARWLYRAYENFFSRWTAHLIFVSAEEQSAARGQRLWAHAPSSVIVNGVSPISDGAAKRMRELTRTAMGIADDAFVVTTLSRFDYQKNMSEAYEIAKAWPRATFLWMGDGEEAGELKRRAQTDRVSQLRFLGTLDDPTAVLAASDVYLSTSRWEGLPLAVLEAMACGLPIVASDVTGHREIVGQSGGGFLYTLGAIDEAVGRLRELSADNALLGRLGKRGRDVQRNCYSAAKMAKVLGETYQRVVMNRVAC